MKRLLLVSHVFPPEPSPGALRPGYLARYLPRFGWNVTVLTHSRLPAPFPADILQADDVLPAFSKLPFRVRDRLLIPDTTTPWIPHAIRLGRAELARKPYDAVLSTALPASVHLVAHALAQQSGLPWLADYRDPWSGNAYALRSSLRRALELRLEKRLVARACELTAVSDPLARLLRALHPKHTVTTIPNAHDPSEWESIQRTPSGLFDLTYTGSMYDGKRSPDLLFRGLSALRAEHDPAFAPRVHFYGPNSTNVMPAAIRHGVAASVTQHGVVTRLEAMRAQRNSAVLLLFLNMDPATSGEMGSKLLEYVGSRRAILAFGPSGSVVRDFIERHQLGWFASTLDEAVAALRCACRYYRAGAPDVVADSSTLVTAVELARRFAQRLDAATGTRSNETIEMEAS